MRNRLNNLFLYSFMVGLAFLTVTLTTAQSTVTFYANISDSNSESGWIGHVWVGLKNGNIPERIVGFYPGGLRNDAKRSTDVSFSFTVRSLGPALKVISEYEEKGYYLGYRDCRAFASDIASSVGLRTPPRGFKSPSEWLSDLVGIYP